MKKKNVKQGKSTHENVLHSHMRENRITGQARNDKSIRYEYYLAGVTAIITFIVYLTSLQNDFVGWDDGTYVVENPFIRSFNGALLKWAFFDFYASNWHPLTWISHALDYAIWGLNPLGHHLTNNILHAVNTFLVVLLVVRLLASRQAGRLAGWQADKLTSPHDARFALIAAVTTGLLFGIHPIHVESVAWVAERKDLLCAMFFLLSIMMYTRYVTPPASPPPLTLRVGRGRYFLSLLFFTLAMMSKPMAVSLPIVLLILDWYPFNRISSLKTFRISFIEKLPFIAISIGSSILTVMAQKEAIMPMELAPLSTRVLVGVESLIGYLWKMILPVNLIPFYPYPNPNTVSPFFLEYFVALVLVAGLTAACLIIAKKQKFWLSAWGYYVITLIPVLGIVQVGSQSMADRYMYLPSLGPFIIMGLVAAWGLSKVTTLKKWKPAIRLFIAVAAISTFIVLAYLTSQQTSVWKNNMELWSYVIAKEPMKVPFAYYNLGMSYDKMGQYNKALEQYDKAIALNPASYETYSIRGYVLFEMGQFDKALEDYDRAIALNPSYFEAYNNRGIAFDEMGQYINAMKDFEKAIALNPSHFEAYYNFGTTYGKTSQFDKAVEAFNRAIALNPNYAYAYGGRGLAYSHLGQYESALNDLHRALALDYNYAKAYVDRGNLYIKTGNKELAVTDFQKACALGNQSGCSALQSVGIGK
jgi:Tfp pilus assembly protein PilF